MKDKWIIDVLSDLRAFAYLNDLERLEGALSDAVVIAAQDLAERQLRAKEQVPS